MSLGDIRVMPTLKAYTHCVSLFDAAHSEQAPKRTLPFDQEPGFHPPAGLWLYGNVKLLEGPLAFLPQSLGEQDGDCKELDELQTMTENLVLDSKIIVCGVHNFAHQRVAVVPLRWGSPRIVVFSGGFHAHLGPDLKNEAFRAARLWRYQWDAQTDLAVSRRAPDKLPTYSLINPTVDRMIERIATSDWPGLRTLQRDELQVLI
jgi:hypothetical protein